MFCAFRQDWLPVLNSGQNLGIFQLGQVDRDIITQPDETSLDALYRCDGSHKLGS